MQKQTKKILLQEIEEELNNYELTEEQIEQINLGFKNGLTIKQIKVYAKPEFNKYQMKIIREGFEKGLLMEQVLIYARPEFSEYEMMKLKTWFLEDLPLKQIRTNIELIILRMDQVEIILECLREKYKNMTLEDQFAIVDDILANDSYYQFLNNKFQYKDKIINEIDEYVKKFYNKKINKVFSNLTSKENVEAISTKSFKF